MWSDLSAAWQCAFEEAWAAFRQGSIPIGAVICDAEGNVLIRERNRTAEPGQRNRRIAHAEANALRRLDTAACDPDSVVLYTTMEPCPMCMGTAVMANIRHLRYAARDPYCGCVRWMHDDPYIRRKHLDYTLTGNEPETVQLVMQSYHELRTGNDPDSNPVLTAFRTMNRTAVCTAERLFREKRLDSLADSDADAALVYDAVCICAAEIGKL